MGAEPFNLRAFPGTIDTRKAEDFCLPSLESRAHWCSPGSRLGALIRTHFGWLGLVCETPATVPRAAPASATTTRLIRKMRTRRCFAGAMAAPAGLEAATPVVLTVGAAAVPTCSAGV